jgi:hypothetical protein
MQCQYGLMTYRLLVVPQIRVGKLSGVHDRLVVVSHEQYVGKASLVCVS